jgi:hypothetical protein
VIYKLSNRRLRGESSRNSDCAIEGTSRHSGLLYKSVLISIILKLFQLVKRSRKMQAIRIPDEDWGKVWRALVALGPLSCVGLPPVYFVNDRQLRMLRRKKLPFEIVSIPNECKVVPNHVQIGPSV